MVHEMKKILVVEDQAAMVKVLTEILIGEGYLVFSAANGELGIQKAKSEIPDLIIMDVMMPVKNGIDAIRELRNDPLFTKIPIIVLTAKGGWNDKYTAFEAGANALIAKPFSPGEILSEINKLLN